MNMVIRLIKNMKKIVIAFGNKYKWELIIWKINRELWGVSSYIVPVYSLYNISKLMRSNLIHEIDDSILNVHIAEPKVTIETIVRINKFDNKIQFQVWLLISSFSLPKYLFLHKKNYLSN